MQHPSQEHLLSGAPVSDAAVGAHVAGPCDDQKLEPFFRGQAGILKTYEIDYEAIAAYDTEVQFSSLVTQFLCPPLWPFLCCSLPVYLTCTKQNVKDKALATHVAITHDGIKYVVDHHKTGCRLDCQDTGKVSKTVPYDKMTDCDIEEPAGAVGPCCWLVPRTLKTVHVDTASSGGMRVLQDGRAVVTHELTLRGLSNPEIFKQDVWAMKRGEPVEGVLGTVAPLAVSMVRDGGGGGGGRYAAAEEPVAPLLMEQHKTMQEHSALLRQMIAGQEAVVAALAETNALLAAKGPGGDMGGSDSVE